jgi:hemolysin activation/secretion protein
MSRCGSQHGCMGRRKNFQLAHLICASFPLLLAFPATAQRAPDAGRVLQEEFTQPLAPPRESPGLNIQVPATAKVDPGGPKVTLGGINFEGNTVFENSELAAVAGDVQGQSFDLAGLRDLADRVTRYYQQAGYPFARAVVPQQQFSNGGTLQVRVIEGRYGKVTALGEAGLAEPAQGYLVRLVPGQLIESSQLERTTLLLDDLPGIEITPIIRPGVDVGAGDLDVTVERQRPYVFRVGLDNYGNYYSGQWRARAGVEINSPFMLGDQLNINALYTQEDLWLGSAQYSLPVGISGLRASAAYAQTAYSLGNGFQGNEGIARIASAGLSFPLLRSQRSNVNLSATWQYKRLYNSYFYGAATERYHSSGVPVSLGFDHRDSLGGGGITYGVVTWTHGNLSKNDTIRRGSFNKYNLDLARLQSLPAGFNLFARLSAQWADKNLDSSESMGLGGPAGVRAYPLGESSGDQGWLTQIELRYSIHDFTPYVFYDHGRMKINAKPSQVVLPAPDETRAGAGFGLRYYTSNWNIDATVAWRTKGGKPTSDTHNDPKPRFWLAVGYTF